MHSKQIKVTLNVFLYPNSSALCYWPLICPSPPHNEAKWTTMCMLNPCPSICLLMTSTVLIPDGKPGSAVQSAKIKLISLCQPTDIFIKKKYIYIGMTNYINFPLYFESFKKKKKLVSAGDVFTRLNTVTKQFSRKLITFNWPVKPGSLDSQLLSN